MWSVAPTVASGDTVILWLGRDIIQALVVTPGKVFNGRYGAFPHDALVGVLYGSKVFSQKERGFLYVLRPTPELWTLALPHRTQILYLADIAFVTSMLAVRPGSTVIEAGTGSGSFSHSVARTVGSKGHLFSFDFHQDRVDKARIEFQRHGLHQRITLAHRNVCKDGFGLLDRADAVFLDLPAPWEAVPHVKLALRSDISARVCCFSPCIEQVMRTVAALNENAFSEIQTYESLLFPQETYSNPAPPPVSQITNALKESEIKREQRRLRQISNAQLRKRKRDEDADDQNLKRPRLQDPAPSDPGSSSSVPQPVPDADPDHRAPADLPDNPPKIVVSKTIPEVRGHTSYLTFAILLPSEFRPRSHDATTLDTNIEQSATKQEQSVQ
ncbi:tRNA methyltransferase complex GCD14 subunit [Sistotremastrum suecicum HHB10207 ss-3]|uniref:tRNA (adenine(58)-N(1))-methyltransferase catalytic subunit TRM61 n=1 Tax=Sistotremastrum suecicum HHB10207 ss-3 TaxID=1314776 RepID=A0A166HFE5_9AGAM|nr:tRNA methyltransferase complex GCD14 subunit [Sistotremastrum suecicum HHB10207 ss-3]